MITVELDEQISQELSNLYARPSSARELYTGDKLQQYYATFRDKFGPERLLELNGKELLYTLKGNKEHDSLIWLRRKERSEMFRTRLPKAYLSNLTDEQWKLLQPLILAPA